MTFSLNTPTESRPSTAIGCPHHYDPDRDLIKLSVHSWLLTIGKMNILIDCCCGNNKRRPARPFWNMLDTLYLERLATAGARPQDIDYEMCTHLHTITLRACSIPVASGIVPRLDRPSGNVTGFALYEATMGGKWLELLSEIAPGLKRAALMFNPDRFSTLLPAAAPVYMPSLETAARSLKVAPIVAPVHSDAEIETATTALGRKPGGGLVCLPDAFVIAHRSSIISAAARNNVPAVYTQSFYVGSSVESVGNIWLR